MYILSVINTSIASLHVAICVDGRKVVVHVIVTIQTYVFCTVKTNQ